jgi:hypothetical protein
VLEVLERLFPYAAIAFVEEGQLAPGPSRGIPAEPLGALPISFRDAKIAELHVAPPAADAEEQAFLERVALLISPHCLVGWDTGGVPWSELG